MESLLGKNNYYTKIDHGIRNYASKKGYSEFKITYKDVPKSYSSVAKLITIEGIMDGRSQEEHLFAKALTNSKARNDRLKLDIKFQREALMYENVLNLFQELQNVLPDKDKLPLTKCIEAKYDYIILENLKTQDFVDISEEKYLDLDHMTLMMQELGKFHALSFVLKHRDPQNFEMITRQMNDLFFPESRRQTLVVTTWKYAVSAIKDKDVKSRMLSKENELNRAIHEKYFPENGVICHGDFNIRNVLFKYDKQRKPTSMIMIDYQLSYYDSPVRDIFFTMASSVTNEIRKDHYGELLNVYYTSLCNFASLHKLDVSNNYSREDFNDDLNKYFPYALANNLVTLRVICSPRRSDEDMDKIYDNPQGTGSIFIYNSEEAESEYAERINELMKHYVDMNYI